MIRNIIKAVLFFAVVVSASSVAHVATALDLSLENNSSDDPYHPFAWTPETVQQPSRQNSRSMIMQRSKGNSQMSDIAQKKFSLKVFQGDGLDDLRRNPDIHNMVILPEEDTEAYGIWLKQRF